MRFSLNLSYALKIALFATGLAGIVAEFVLSTLATYLLGNAVFQWTIVMSLMLFSMGLGSRLSARVRNHILDAFIWVEFALSLLCASSAALAYGLAAQTSNRSLVIYATAIGVGLLIGMEIPLVTRLNEAYEELRVNISAVMEKDYFGALFGGLFFAFFALPYLGLTYTPIALGTINFVVASFLLLKFFHLTKHRKGLIVAFALCALYLAALTIFAKPVVRYGEQAKYKDVVIYSRQTPYQKIVMTQWKRYYWLYLNGQEQFSTYDEERYHEPLVHPALRITADRSRVLILGGGDGLALREALKYPDVKSVTLVDMDADMTELARTFPILVDINRASFHDPRVTVINEDASAFIREDDGFYGAIIIDMPDPDTIDLTHVYSLNFYRSVKRRLIRGGVAVTQASSPFFAKQAFLCVVKTMRAAGFSVLPYHNSIATMGEWGWSLGVADLNEDDLKQRALSADYTDVPTRFMDRDAMISMTHFGKGVLEPEIMAEIKINTEMNPTLFTYYLKGNWGAY